MSDHRCKLILALALAPYALAHAAETPAAESAAVAQEKAACKQQEQQDGKGEKTSEVVCAIKVMFQSRIRRRKDSEPVEMTVGSPPMQSEDTDTPGANNWEINVGMHAGLAGPEKRIEGPVFDINYGIGDRLQLTYELPYVFQSEPRTAGSGSIHANGVGDSTLGLKYRFYDNEDTGLSFAVYPQIEFRTPGANRDVSEGATAITVPLVMTKEFEHASIAVNGGVTASGGDRRYFASFGIGRRASENNALLAEIVGDDLNAADEKRVLLNFGIRHKISDTRSLSAALGRDIYAGGDQGRNTYFTIAYQMLIGE